MRICVVIPVFNHERAVTETVANVRKHGLSVLLVDDGSNDTCATVLRTLSAADTEVALIRLERNQGKGAAVMAGLLEASQLGFSHVLQVDADGQHDASALPRFVAAAFAMPDEVICGEPCFDTSMPRHRFFLRYLTHLLVWLNTLSFEIRDSMCGFRIYPLAYVLPLVKSGRLGKRMDFDIEILVRLHWLGVVTHWIPIQVKYPADGVSHFRLLRDNALLTMLQVRLFFGMLGHLPTLLERRFRSQANESREGR